MLAKQQPEFCSRRRQRKARASGLRSRSQRQVQPVQTDEEHASEADSRGTVGDAVCQPAVCRLRPDRLPGVTVVGCFEVSTRRRIGSLKLEADDSGLPLWPQILKLLVGVVWPDGGQRRPNAKVLPRAHVKSPWSQRRSAFRYGKQPKALFYCRQESG